jgi:hypothetical protein
MRRFCWNACKTEGFEENYLHFWAVLEKIPAYLHLFPYIKEDLRGIPVFLQEFALRRSGEVG